MRHTQPDSAPVWRKSSFSGGNNGECVEVAFMDGAVWVRDTKHHGDGATLTFTRAEWAAFLAGVAAGEFEQP